MISSTGVLNKIEFHVSALMQFLTEVCLNFVKVKHSLQASVAC